MTVRSGNDYLAALGDSRSIYFEGQPVEDVRTHPAFAKATASFAKCTTSSRARNLDLMTFDVGEGRRVNRAWQMPRSHETWSSAGGAGSVVGCQFRNAWALTRPCGLHHHGHGHGRRRIRRFSARAPRRCGTIITMRANTTFSSAMSCKARPSTGPSGQTSKSRSILPPPLSMKMRRA